MVGTSWLVRLLGPVDVSVDGRVRPVTGLRRRAVIAALALQAGQTVSAAGLIKIVWGCSPPATAWNTLQRHVSALRGAPGVRAPIVGRPPGYLLDIPSDATDVAQAEALIRRGRPDDPQEAAARLRRAVGLWRSRALFDLTSLPWFEEQSARLEEMRLEAVQALIEIRLSLGEHESLIPELEALVDAYPFRENLHRLLMLALYAAGRQADALTAYRRLQRNLREELALEPSPPLRELELAILRQDLGTTCSCGR